MKKTILFLFICVFPVVMLTGCWDKREIKHLGVVSGVAIDREENGLIRLTVDLLNGSPGNAGNGRAGGDYHIMSFGETVYQAISNLEDSNNRSLTWQHNSVIILSESLLDRSIFEYLDVFIRYTDMRPKGYVVVTPERAFDIINTPIGDDWVNSLGLSRLLYVQGRRHQSTGNGVSIGEFVTDSVQEYAASYLPVVTLHKKEPSKKESAATESTNNPGQLKEEVVLDGFTVFNEGLPAGNLGIVETKGLLWYLGKEKKGSLSIAGLNGGIINLEVLDIKVKPKFEVKDEKPVLRVKVTIYSNIVEIFEDRSPSTQEEFMILEEHQKESMEKILTQTFHKSQELNADFLKIAQLAKKTDYKWWKKNEAQWSQIFPKIQIVFDVNSNIYFTGNIHEDIEEN